MSTETSATTMTGAELRSLTESLGFSVAWLSKRWRATESTIKNWMYGSHEIPPYIAKEINLMVDDTNDRLDQLTARLHPGDELPTYRTDHEYRDAVGEDAPYSASWHRTLCARAADEVDVKLVWAVPPTRRYRRTEDGSYERLTP